MMDSHLAVYARDLDCFKVCINPPDVNILLVYNRFELKPYASRALGSAD